MSNYISEFIARNEVITPNLENQHTRFTYITFLPIQLNSSFNIDEKGVKTFWFQLVSNYKSSYQSIDENGEISDENAVIKTLTVKFPMEYITKQKLKISDLKTFFEKNFVNKKFLTLPVEEEMPVFELKNNIRNLVKNHTQTNISEHFNLKEFIDSFNTAKVVK